LKKDAGVVELVDTCDSKSHVFGRAGSIPASGTKKEKTVYTVFSFSSLFPLFGLYPEPLLFQ
jgi:hypothetical protein